MEIEKFVRTLGIEKEVVFDNDVPTIFLDNSDEFAKVYTSLTESEEVKLESESVVISSDIASLRYSNNDFIITLSADLSRRDIYKLTIEENL